MSAAKFDPYLWSLATQIHGIAGEHGFWDHQYIEVPSDGEALQLVDNPSIFEEKLMLIVSEVAEVLEARRDDLPTLEKEECADILIRVLDYCAARNFDDIHDVVLAKIRKNEERPHLHGRVK